MTIRIGDLLLLTPEEVRINSIPLPAICHLVIITGPLESDGTFPFRLLYSHEEWAVVEAFGCMLAIPPRTLHGPSSLPDDPAPY